jgi:hypothetical protein
MRETEIKNLRGLIAEENSKKEMELSKITEESGGRMENMEKKHITRVADLEKRMEQLEKDLATILLKNEKEEEKLRNDYKRGENNYHEKLKEYDQDMEEKTEALEKITIDFQAKRKELTDVEEIYTNMMEEKDRKLEEERKMKAKQQVRENELKLLNQASEWVQAHWKGLVARRDVEKMLKGRKKKKKPKR